MTQVFISYSRRDLAFVKTLAADLQATGLDVWYDLSRLEGGDTWPEEIQIAIDESDKFIIVISPDSIISKWVRKEFLYASRNNKKIVPLFYRNCKLPLWLLDIHFIDIQGSKYLPNYKRILRALDIKRSDREAAEKFVLARAEREAAEKAEHDATEKTLQEKEKQEVVEKAKRERAKRKTAQMAALASKSSQLIKSLKSTSTKVVPVFRILAILGVIVFLFWGGSWVIPKIVEAIPTEEPRQAPTPTATTTSTVTTTFTPFASPSLTPTFALTNTVTFTATLTNTATITPTPTRTATPTLTSTPTPAFACDTINEIPAYGTAIKQGKNFKVGFTIVNTGNSVWPEETALRLGSNPYGMVDVPSALPKIPRLEPDDTIKVGPFDAKAPDQVGFYIVSFTLGDGSCNPFITFNIVK